MIRVSRQPPQLLKIPLIRFEPTQGGSVTHHPPHITPLGWEPHQLCPSIGTYCLRYKGRDPVRGRGVEIGTFPGMFPGSVRGHFQSHACPS
eukprot:1238477-Prymnesium_polylepis.1